MCLFTTKENKNMYNSNMLLTLNKTYPVCLCKSITIRLGKQVSLNSHYDEDRSPSYTLLIKDTVVQLSGWNAKPEWGLFHGYIGKIIDIVYKENKSLLLGISHHT